MLGAISTSPDLRRHRWLPGASLEVPQPTGVNASGPDEAQADYLAWASLVLWAGCLPDSHA